MGKLRVIVMKSADNVCTVVENIEPGSVVAVPDKASRSASRSTRKFRSATSSPFAPSI